MAERHISNDCKSETEELFGDNEDAPAFAVRRGANLARKTGIKDEFRH